MEQWGAASSPREPAAAGAGTPGLLGRARTLLAEWGCSPAETAALAVLAAAAFAALALLWIATHGHGPPGGDAAAAGGAAPPVAGDPGDPGDPGAADHLPAVEVEATVPAEVVVHVVGRVASPGLYRLPQGARVGDALDAAGGARADAAPAALNLARVLTDGEQLVVPAVGEVVEMPPAVAAGGAAGGAEASAVRPDGLLDLNRAAAADLEELPGVGPVLAASIVDHRESLGGRFSSVEQLREVPGIGDARFRALAELVAV